MGIRTPAYRQHHPPLDSFRISLRLLSADFTELYNILGEACCIDFLPFGVLGWRFGTLPPHFTHRNISSPKFRATIALRLCAQAFHLRTCRTIVIPISFEQIDSAPDTERGSERDDEGLKSTDGRVEEFHIFSPFRLFKSPFIHEFPVA